MNRELIKYIWKIGRYLLLLMLAGGLIWITFRNISLPELTRVLVSGNYKMAVPVLLISASGYFFRVLRFRMILRATGSDCRLQSLYATLCLGYLVSLAIPRLGEVTRVISIRKTDQVPLSQSIIAIIFERLVDTLTFALLILVGLVFSRQQLQQFIGNPFSDANLSSVWPIGAFLLVVLLLLIFARQRLLQWLPHWRMHIRQIIGLFAKPNFLIHTLAIWICYDLMTWLWCYVFEESAALSAWDAFLVMLVGSFGRSLPLQGGSAGAYHFLVSRFLVLLGISLAVSNALALIIHGIQMIFTIIMGSLGYLWLIWDTRSSK